MTTILKGVNGVDYKYEIIRTPLTEVEVKSALASARIHLNTDHIGSVDWHFWNELFWELIKYGYRMDLGYL
jgi:hypothetical protein